MPWGEIIAIVWWLIVFLILQFRRQSFPHLLRNRMSAGKRQILDILRGGDRGHRRRQPRDELSNGGIETNGIPQLLDRRLYRIRHAIQELKFHTLPRHT